MPILVRYLFRQYLPIFFLCVAVCTGVLLMNQFLRLFNLAVMKGISPLWIFSCFARLLPYFFSLAVPIAFLVALLLTLGTLSESGEILALRSSGFSFVEMLWPFFALAAGLCVLLFVVNHKTSPEGFHSFKREYEAAVAQVSKLDIEPNTFFPFGDWKIFAQGSSPATGKLTGVYLVKVKGEQQGLRIDAPDAQIGKNNNGFFLELFKGTIQFPSASPARFASAVFNTYRVLIPLVDYRAVQRNPDIQELNTRRLREKLRDGGLDDAHRKEYLTEATLRTVGSATPLVFFWIGCPLGLRLEKHAKATGFAWALLVLFFFYGFLATGIGLGRRSLRLSPVAPWLPVAGGVIAGATFWRRNLRR